MIALILIAILIYYDLKYVKSNHVLALLIAGTLLLELGKYQIWFITFLITALVFEISMYLKRNRFIDYDDYIHLANSIIILNSISDIVIFAILYILLILLISRFYRNRIPTSAEMYISALAVQTIPLYLSI
ncbi:MAG: hypothetical protein QXU27_02385 [Candidatus Anstonellales archaeon]